MQSIHRYAQQSRTRRGFTLVELLVVISIIVVLAALLLTAVSGSNQSADKVQAQGMINNLYMACEQFKLENFRYPAQQGDRYISDVSGGLLDDGGAESVLQYFHFDRKFLKSDNDASTPVPADPTLVDPWDQPYVYTDASWQSQTTEGSEKLSDIVGHANLLIMSAGRDNLKTSLPFFEDWRDPETSEILPIYKKKGK